MQQPEEEGSEASTPSSATTSAVARSTARSLSPGRTFLTVTNPRAPVTGEMPDVTAAGAARAKAEARESKRAASSEEGVEGEEGLRTSSAEFADVDDLRIRRSSRLSAILCCCLGGRGGRHRDNRQGDVEAIIFPPIYNDALVLVQERKTKNENRFSKNEFFFLQRENKTHNET